MGKFIVAFLLIAALGACSTPAPSMNPSPTPPSAGAHTYLALGDSYTIGASVPAVERFPMKLAEALRGRGLMVDEPQIIARTGWTTDELAAAIDSAAPHGPFDLVTLLIGVNDQYRGYDVNDYQAGFHRLLERSIGLAGGDAGRVIVVSIPDWGVTPFAAGRDRERIAAEIDVFNALNRREAESAGARYVDVTAISRRAIHEPALIADDGLHPSAQMYAGWVEELLPEALAVLSQ